MTTTTDFKGELPSSGDYRIEKARSARSMYSSLRTKSDTRRKEQALVWGQLSGNRPYSKEKLKELGQSWRANVNFRDAQSMVDVAIVAYWRLFNDASNRAYVEVLEDSPYADRDAKAFQSAYDRFLEEDWADGYVTEYLKLVQELIVTGIGPVTWDGDSPRFKTVKLSELEVPDRTPASVESFEIAFARHETTLSDVWAKIRNPTLKQASSDVGWNVKALETLIARVLKGEGTGSLTPDDYVRVQEKMRNNSLEVSNEKGSIDLVYVFIREFDGKVSTNIFAEGIEDTLADGDGWLFTNRDRDDRSEAFGEVFTCLFFEVGNGMFHGIQGFGLKNFQLMELINRLKCRAADRTVIDGLNFQQTEDGRTNAPLANFGPVNVIDVGLKQVPNYPTGNATMDTINLFERQVNGNNARTTQTDQIAQAGTASQASILAQLQSSVDVANATLFLTQLANNILRRQFTKFRTRGNTDPDAKKFKARCLKAGMDPESFHDAEIAVRTGANPGAASASLRAQIARELMSMMGNPLVNSRVVMEEFVSNTLGGRAVKQFLIPEDRSKDAGQLREAMFENNFMGEGLDVPVDEHDLHDVHLEEHIRAAMRIIQMAQKGEIDDTAMMALALDIKHMDAHLQMLARDRFLEGKYKQLKQMYTEIRAETERIAGKLQRQKNLQINDAQQATMKQMKEAQPNDPNARPITPTA